MINQIPKAEYDATWCKKKMKMRVLKLLYWDFLSNSWNFFPKCSPFHCLLWGHTTFNNETIFRQVSEQLTLQNFQWSVKWHGYLCCVTYEHWLLQVNKTWPKLVWNGVKLRLTAMWVLLTAVLLISIFYQHCENIENDCQSKRLWLQDNFSLSVPKEVYRGSIENMDIDVRV